MSHAFPELAEFVGVRVIGEVLIRFNGVVLVPAVVTTWQEWPSYRTLLLQGEGPFIYYDRNSWVAGGEKRDLAPSNCWVCGRVGCTDTRGEHT